ncbi:FecR family protein [Verrucomicrobium sp. GAS474]|uniref:FecR family protein n=1 Tax=Verrucomicrobium sp. GAS474 TaxID=1882831 RepID=UPI0012FFA700|nr:FecR family protein [Verrucomicrobium sp. GAS474]
MKRTAKGIALLLILGLCGTVATAGLMAAPVDAVAKKPSGSVQAALPGGDFAKVTDGQKLPSGTTIKTGADASVILVTTPGTGVRVEENTTIKIDNLQFAKTSDGISQRKATVDVQNGTVSCLIDHSTPDVTDFVVKTPQGSAAARGTFYGVSVVNGQSFVKVAEGKVGVAAKVAKKDDKPKDGKPATAVDKANADQAAPVPQPEKKPAI